MTFSKASVVKNVSNFGDHRWLLRIDEGLSIWTCDHCGMRRYSMNAQPAGGCVPITRLPLSATGPKPQPSVKTDDP